MPRWNGGFGIESLGGCGKLANIENIRKWVKALESGAFTQAQGALHRVNVGYCCLGVACVAAIDDGVEIQRETASLNDSERFDGASSYLPAKVADWLGVDGGNPKLAGNSATWWNDDVGASFDGIAQLVRHEYGLPMRFNDYATAS
jgi:hypothetical protein